MAMRKCIIATTMAAEGIFCHHGKDILIADTPDEFYRSILQCITNPGKLVEIGEQARKTADKYYNISTISERMLKIYERLLNA
jgi:glycosyltransferase involved in cell wall biosynthesis